MDKHASAAACSLANFASTLLGLSRMVMVVDAFLLVCLSVEVPLSYKILITSLLLAPTSQLQCDIGASPQPSFSIDSSGKFHHNDTTDFEACVSGHSDQLNIYTIPPPADVTGCRPIELHADRCQGAPTQPPSGPPPISPPPVMPPPISPSPPVSPPHAPPQPEVSSAAPGPSPSVGPIVPPKVPQPAEGPSSCPITTITQISPAIPGPGAQSPPGQPPGGHGGPTTPGAPNIPAESSGPRTPSAPGGVHTAPGPPPFANSSVATATGICATGLCPTGTGKIFPTGTSGPGGFAPGAGGGGCGTNLVNGSFEFPHLIILIDSSSPNKAAGTSFNGTVTSTMSSIFNFDFLPSSANKQCSLVFLFPTQDKLETSAFSFSGDGAIRFLELQAPASSSTSFSNAPQVKVDFGVTNVSPGHTYTIATFACPAGQTVAFELKNDGSTNLDFFEDFNPSP